MAFPIIIALTPHKPKVGILLVNIAIPIYLLGLEK